MQNTEKAPQAQQFGDVVALFPQKSNAVDTAKIPKASEQALAFLRTLDADGWHNLVALNPSEDRGPPVDARTFAPGQFDEIAKWVDSHDGRHNIYYSVNEPRPGSPNKKLSGDDIRAIRAIVADIDLPPLPSGTRTEAVDAAVSDHLKTITALAGKSSAPPTMTIDTGGGAALVWKLDRRYRTDQSRSWAENQGRGIAAAFGGDDVHDLARIMRLPGSENIPTPSKVKKGRVRRRASMTECRLDRVYGETHLSTAYTPIAGMPLGNERADVAAAAEAIDMYEAESHSSYEVLPEKLRSDFEAAQATDPKLKSLWGGDPTGLIGGDTSGSGWRFSLAVRLSHHEKFGPQDFANLVMVWPKVDHDKIDHRALARDWGRGAAPNIAKRERVLGYHEPIQDAAPPVPALNRWIDPREWEGKPIPPRQWEVEGWIPRGEVTLLYGDGGTGKSLLIHQYATAAAVGVPWLGQKTRPGRIMGFMCEDSAEELQRRQADINGVLHVAHSDLGNLRLQSRKQEDNVLAFWDRSSGLKLTRTWEQLRADAVAFAADVLIVDTLSDVFAGDEVNRVQVNAFVKVALGRLAASFGGSVIALGHPSLSGLSSGSGMSGSTAWNNAVRSRLYLRYHDRDKRGNVRELETMKSNYAAKGSLLKIKWDRGAFSVIAGRTTVDEVNTGWPSTMVPRLDDAAESATIKALNECAGVSLSPGRTSVNYAPKVLKNRCPELLADLTAVEVADAITRLERKGKIRHGEIGRNASRKAILGYVVIPDNPTDKIPENSSDEISKPASVFA